MKRILTAFTAVFVAKCAFAQQLPHYTQYILNNFIINPAVAGIENYTDIKISHRQQWVGLDGAPKTTYITIHAPLKKSDEDRPTATTVGPSNENPRGRQYWTDYIKADPHHGVGLTVINDRTGPLNRFAGYATYAYHLGLTPQTSISVGASLGLQNLSLDASKLQWGGGAGSTDPAVAGSGYLNKIRPDMNIGVWLYSANYFVGLAAQQIVSQKLQYGGGQVTEVGKTVPHIFLQAGYRILLNDDINFLPSVNLKYVSPLDPSFDLNGKFQYRDLVWVGGSYRHNDGIAGMLGININSTINLGYSYDATTSRLNSVSNGTHEFVIGFLLGNRYGDWCPRNIW
jgi:type IX secretion system PorP/SprF family membrane protein